MPPARTAGSGPTSRSHPGREGHIDQSPMDRCTRSVELLEVVVPASQASDQRGKGTSHSRRDCSHPEQPPQSMKEEIIQRSASSQQLWKLEEHAGPPASNFSPRSGTARNEADETDTYFRTLCGSAVTNLAGFSMKVDELPQQTLANSWQHSRTREAGCTFGVAANRDFRASWVPNTQNVRHG